MASLSMSNKAWYDKAFISVAQLGGNEVQLTAKTNSMSLPQAGIGFESIEVFEGKISRPGTREDMEISFDGVPTNVQDFDWIFHGTSNTATSITSTSLKKYRITVLWTNQTGITSATQAIDTASEAYRHIYANAYCTGLEYNMDAGEHLTATLTFTLAPEDETGGQNYKKEACDTSSALSAVPAYTTTTKF